MKKIRVELPTGQYHEMECTHFEVWGDQLSVYRKDEENENESQHIAAYYQWCNVIQIQKVNIIEKE